MFWKNNIKGELLERASYPSVLIANIQWKLCRFRFIIFIAAVLTLIPKVKNYERESTFKTRP